MLSLIGFIAFGFLYWNLLARLKKLEGGQNFSKGDTINSKPVSVSSPDYVRIENASPSFSNQLSNLSQLSSTKNSHGIFSGLISWLKADWLLKLGAFLLLLGFGWLATYAFLNGWIGEAGRITLGLLLGAAVMGLGFWRMQKFSAQGAVFLVLGSTAILLTTFAARALYDFFTPASALALMFMSTAFVAFASVVYDRKPLSVASVVLAGLAPFLTWSTTSDFVVLFAYLALVLIGSLWIVAFKEHRILALFSLIVTAIYSLTAFASAPLETHNTLLLFSFGFAILFFGVNTAGLLRLQGVKAITDLVTAGLNALLLSAWIVFAVDEDWRSLVFVAWALVFVVGAFIVRQITNRNEAFFVYAGVGMAFIAAATASELDGAALTIAYTIEAGLVSILALIITNDVRISQRASWLIVGPVLLSLGSILSRSWINPETSVLNEHFFVLLTLAIMFFLIGIIGFKFAHATENNSIIKMNASYFVIGSAYVFILIWHSLHLALYYDQEIARLVSVFTYTGVASASYFIGLLKNNSGLRLYGGVLIGLLSAYVLLSGGALKTEQIILLALFTIIGIAAYVQGKSINDRRMYLFGGILLGAITARLILVEAWSMGIEYKIVTFFVIGVLLMSTAFIGKKSGTKV